MALQPKKSAAARNKAAKAKSASHHEPRKPKVVQVADRYQLLVEGVIGIDDLDEEELYRGQLRNATGDFRGRPPKYVPREFATALQTAVAKKYTADVAALVPVAIAAIERVMKKPHPQPGDGAVVTAAFKTIERFAGKVPETVKLQAEITTWEKHIQEVTVVYEEPDAIEAGSTKESEDESVEVVYGPDGGLPAVDYGDV